MHAVMARVHVLGSLKQMENKTNVVNQKQKCKKKKQFYADDHAERKRTEYSYTKNVSCATAPLHFQMCTLIEIGAKVSQQNQTDFQNPKET